ncbi:serine hydrolase domain-containing protein [Parvularcula oceani]|uniref:serine hydrolase domain-containing protein n=1 Tax=Parvularcula oceani TaxID=1247963 RepID=UPI00056326AE|nr:serine hydrolase [Parvularcula oceani]
MRKLLAALGTVLVLLLVAGALWAFRPWSEYSPYETISLATADDRTGTYRAMERTYPYRVIEGADTVYSFPRAAEEIGTGFAWEGEALTLDDYADAYEITGLMVVSDGEVVLERYFRGETADSRHTSWSVAKSVIATLIGRAILEGEIESVDDRVADYAGEYAGTDYGDTSIRHLLMMSSGIDFEEEYERADGDARRLFLDTFIFNRDIDGSIGKFERNRPAGTDFDYISTNSAVLAAVLRGAYDGRSIADLASEKIFAPLGMREGTWLLDRNDESGKELGYCCLQITLEDYAKIGQLYLQGGVVGRQRVIPADWPAFVSTPPQASHEPGETLTNADYGYGHHFWLPPQRDGEYFMAGYNGQIVWIDPRRDVVIAMTSADPAFIAKPPRWIAMFRALSARAAAGREV